MTCYCDFSLQNQFHVERALNAADWSVHIEDARRFVLMEDCETACVNTAHNHFVYLEGTCGKSVVSGCCVRGWLAQRQLARHVSCLDDCGLASLRAVSLNIRPRPSAF
jgi:hypothetical protein